MNCSRVKIRSQKPDVRSQWSEVRFSSVFCLLLMTARHGSRLGGARHSQAAMPRKAGSDRKLHMQGGRGIISRMRLSDVAEQV